MIGRLIKGLVLGLLIGGAGAGLLIKGLGITTFAMAGGGVPFVAYAAALAIGAIVGLVAGKPIWAKGAWIEALLKTFFGALLAALGMYLARKFGGFEFPFASLGLGSGAIGQLPITTLPAIATVLSVFYAVDNTDSAVPAEKGAHVAGKQSAAKLRVPVTSVANADDGDGGENEVPPAKKAKK